MPQFDYCCHGIECKDCEQCSRTLVRPAMTTPQGMLELADHVAKVIREGMTLSALPKMKEVEAALRQAAAPRGQEAIKAKFKQFTDRQAGEDGR